MFHMYKVRLFITKTRMRTYTLSIKLFHCRICFQTSKVTIDHIESRKAKKISCQHDILIECTGMRDPVTAVMNTIRQNNTVSDIWCQTERLISRQGTRDIILVYVVRKLGVFYVSMNS